MSEELKVFTKEEVEKHNSPHDLWVIVTINPNFKGKVYDVTKFEKHPGGKDPFIEYAGQDATDPFEDEGHSATAKKQMDDFLVGKLEGASDEDEGEMEEVIDTNSGERMRIRKKGIIPDSELKQHCVKGDCWLMIEGRIYDVSDFAHPGGKQILVDNSGRDATREFMDVCHKEAHLHMPSLYIGDSELKNNKVWNPVADDNVEESNTLFYVASAIGIIAVLYLLGLL